MKLRKRQVIPVMLFLMLAAFFGLRAWYIRAPIRKAHQLLRSAGDTGDPDPPSAMDHWLARLGIKDADGYQFPEDLENALVELGQPAVPALISGLKDEDPDVSEVAIAALERVRPISEQA